MKTQINVVLGDLNRDDVYVDLEGRRPKRFILKIGEGVAFPGIPRLVLEAIRDEIARTLDHVDGKLSESDWQADPPDAGKRIA
jgi:hypothetical protein